MRSASSTERSNMPDPITDTLAALGEVPDLKAILDQTAKGLPQPNLNNAVRIFEHGPGFAGLVWKDEFLQRIMTGDPPREWTDADDIEQTIRIQREIGIPKMAVQTVSMAVIAVANQHLRNCVRDWLESSKWDEVERLEHFFEDHFGANGTPYIR